MRGKQTTSSEGEGSPLEVGVEPRGKAEALSISAASEGRRNDVEEDKEEVLERILSRDNLNLAYKKVKSNQGSPGIDGMTVEDVLPFLREQGKLSGKEFLRGNATPTPLGESRYRSLMGELDSLEYLRWWIG